MNVDKFLKQLSKCRTKFSWERQPLWVTNCLVNTRIRGERGDLIFCPITAVCYAEKGVLFNVSEADKASRFLGLRSNSADSIMRAADEENSSRIRVKLLKALGL